MTRPWVCSRRITWEIAEILNPDVSAPNATATHEALLTLAESPERRTRLITTNFDRLFEHAIANGRPAAERFEAPLLPVPKQRWDELVYLHGLLPENPADSNLDNLVVSSGDFGLAYLTERWAARFVSELLRNFVVCFVGYSIDDPVLRYMMDALAADSRLGESPPEMFAFGSFSRGREEARANEWRAKNVTPILYREHRRHAYLHRTLRSWADTYRDGARKGADRRRVRHGAPRHGDRSGRLRQPHAVGPERSEGPSRQAHFANHRTTKTPQTSGVSSVAGTRMSPATLGFRAGGSWLIAARIRSCLWRLPAGKRLPAIRRWPRR